MAVFDRTVKTARRVTDPGTDRSAPGPGALAWGAIASEAALAGTVGADAALINGDQWSQLTGAGTRNVAKNMTTTITGDHTMRLASNHTETVCGTANTTVIGPNIVTNLDVFNETRIGAHIQVHGGIEWQHDEENEFHYGGMNVTFYTEVFEHQLWHWEACAQHNEIKGNHNYFAVNDNAAILFKFETKALNAEVDAAEANIKALKGDVDALQAKLGALEAKAHGCVATAGPDPNPTPLI